MVRAEGGSLRFWGPGLLSTSPAFSMSSASHSAGSSGWLVQKTGAGPTFQWAGKVDAICRSRSNRAKRPRAGCILRSSLQLSSSISKVGHNVVEVNWHISALKFFKFMPHKFHDCLSSAWLTGLTAEMSQTTQ